MQCQLPGLSGTMQAGSTLDDQLATAVQTYETGELGQALELAQRLCIDYPDVAIVHNIHGVISAELSNEQAAIDSYRRAIELDPANCDFHFNLGNMLRATGDLNGALACYSAALHYRPGDADALFNMAGILRAMGDLDNAAKMYQVLVELAPGDPATHNNLGGVLYRQGRTEAAARCFRRALQLQPNFVNAHDNLCEVLEKTGQLADLRQAVLEAEQYCSPKNKRIAIRKARMLRRDQKYAEARKVLSNIAKFHPSQPLLNASCWYLMADLSDRLHDRRAALDAVEQAKNWAHKVASDRGIDPQDFISRVDGLNTAYRSVRREPKTRASGAGDLPRLVFLIGFPCSGAGALSAALASYEGVSCLAERSMVPEISRLAWSWQTEQTPGHEELTTRQVEELRTIYMSGLRRCIPGQVTAGRVVVDDRPLNIVDVGLINKVFPDADFLLAIRHPCDCVLSCFLQAFTLDSATANFLDLKSAADCYDRVMSLWTSYERALSARVMTVRSEQLAGDPKRTLAKVQTFLQLDQQADDADLSTLIPEAMDQDAAANRWREYRTDMISVLPTLLRWAASFGYTGGDAKSLPDDDTDAATLPAARDSDGHND